MKYTVNYYILVLILFSLFSINIVAYEKITIASGEWAPFTSEKDEDGKLAEVLISEALKLVGIDAEFEYYPWKRTYEEAKNGANHATILWIKSDKREKDFLIGEEFLVEDLDVFFHLKDREFKWEEMEDLKQYEIGATEGYYQADYLKKYGIEASEVSTEVLNFRKILAGRIDAYFTSYYAGYNLIRNEFSPEHAKLFSHNNKALRKVEFYILISRNIPNAMDLMERIDKGIKELKDSGRYNEIIEEYFEK